MKTAAQACTSPEPAAILWQSSLWYCPWMTQITKLLSLCWLTFEADDLSYTQKLISEPQRSSLIHTSTENSSLRVQTTKYIHMLSAQKLMFVADLKNRTALCYNEVSFLHIVYVYQYLGSRNCGPGTKATCMIPTSFAWYASEVLKRKQNIIISKMYLSIMLYFYIISTFPTQ